MILEIVTAVGTLFTSGSAVLALIFYQNNLIEQKKLREIVVFQNLFLDVMNSYEKGININYLKNKDKNTNIKLEFSLWKKSFLQKREYLCFLFNNKYILDKKMFGYFSSLIEYSYIELLSKDLEVLKNKERYFEIKKSYGKILDRKK